MGQSRTSLDDQKTIKMELAKMEMMGIINSSCLARAPVLTYPVRDVNSSPSPRLYQPDIIMRPLAISASLLALANQPWFAAADTELELGVSALTGTVESDWTAVYYSDSVPLLLGNDGGTLNGGFHAFELDGDTQIPEVKSVKTGRTKLVTAVYGVDNKDWVVSIAQPDSIMRVFELPGLVESEDSRFEALGDWSALCAWKSKTGNQYLYLFGKGQGIHFLIRERNGSIELVEVSCFCARIFLEEV